MKAPVETTTPLDADRANAHEARGPDGRVGGPRLKLG
jgi:hypothetical protein